MRNLKIAVVGSGISGLSSAYYLSKNYKVDLFEKNAYFGGHTHTQTIKYKGKNISEVLEMTVEQATIFFEAVPKIKKKLVSEALEIFFDLRKIPGLKKKPSTSELID